MRDRYTNIGTGAIAVATIAFGLVVFLGRNSSNGNVWGPGGAPHFVMYVIALSIIVTSWAYARSKGRSGLEGAMGPLGLGFLAKILTRVKRKDAQQGVQADVHEKP